MGKESRKLLWPDEETWLGLFQEAFPESLRVYEPKLALGFADEVAQLDVECTCDSISDLQRRVSLAAFDHADVGPVDLGQLGELFLRQVLSFADSSDREPEFS